MSANVVNIAPYLRTSREYPQDDAHQLSVEVTKTYIDIAQSVNDRTIGIFPTTRPAITGNSYFISSKKQESQRQLYTFTSAGSIPHGIKSTNIFAFIQIYGTFTDGTKWYPLPFVATSNATNQVKLDVDSTNINITAGAGTPPTITQGYIILEWIVNP